MAYGLVDRLVPPGEATKGAIELANQITSNGPIAIRASKEALNRRLTASK
jgi:enoyl-CoA hydratase